ncbi:MAG: bifunctional 5,10-methylenetetrahydrofolate dehydrogenase/5,10-methenyltetrahydrofolate cyclohydrolase [Clostridiales bacterium]|nr:bifunctional 5,10-methylenetetrahydrofolate dehydrogenase/5,10-methenyltetrahydrofolate cyclohydrolase [Clostridiales bacterium]
MAGGPVAARVEEEIRQRLREREARGKRPPLLAIVWVGEDPSSAAYIRAKEKAAQRLGIPTRLVRLPGDAGEGAIAQVVQDLSEDPEVTGILVQAPLPAGVDYEAVIRRLDPRKDVDGFHPLNAGKLFRGRPEMVPCTAKGILELLRYYEIPIRGKHAVVVGRSNIVGRPTAALLEQADATVTLCHSKTEDLPSLTRQGDILVAAVGSPHVIRASMVKPGAAVVDVGIRRKDGKLVGDVHPEVQAVAGALSPVPGGVGPLTVAFLMENVLRAAESLDPL